MGKQAQAFRGSFLEILAVGDGAEFQQRENRNGIARRLRAVVILFHAQNQVRGVGRRLPETAVFIVVKLRQHRVGQRYGEFEMLRLERGFVKVDHPGEQECVGIEQLNRVAFTVAPSVKECAAGITLTRPSATFSHRMGEGWGKGRCP